GPIQRLQRLQVARLCPGDQNVGDGERDGHLLNYKDASSTKDVAQRRHAGTSRRTTSRDEVVLRWRATSLRDALLPIAIWRVEAILQHVYLPRDVVKVGLS